MKESRKKRNEGRRKRKVRKRKANEGKAPRKIAIMKREREMEKMSNSSCFQTKE